MLIRIVDHFRNNPKRIDKLIAIKGLPDEWLFRETPEGKELRAPWKPDIDVNIPMDLRHLCEPMHVNFRYPPIERGQKEIIDRRQILGLKIDYNSEPGREMWEQVERYMEESTPRNERIPIPVVCAKDERSAFETYRPRRTQTGSLEFVPAPVPEIDLTKYKMMAARSDEDGPKTPPTVPPPTIPSPQPQASMAPPAVEQKVEVSEFKCPDCEYTHRSMQGIRMHKVKGHPKKERVPA